MLLLLVIIPSFCLAALRKLSLADATLPSGIEFDPMPLHPFEPPLFRNSYTLAPNRKLVREALYIEASSKAIITLFYEEDLSYPINLLAWTFGDTEIKRESRTRVIRVRKKGRAVVVVAEHPESTVKVIVETREPKGVKLVRGRRIVKKAKHIPEQVTSEKEREKRLLRVVLRSTTWNMLEMSCEALRVLADLPHASNWSVQGRRDE